MSIYSKTCLPLDFSTIPTVKQPAKGHGHFVETDLTIDQLSAIIHGDQKFSISFDVDAEIDVRLSFTADGSQRTDEGTLHQTTGNFTTRLHGPKCFSLACGPGSFQALVKTAHSPDNPTFTETVKYIPGPSGNPTDATTSTETAEVRLSNFNDLVFYFARKGKKLWVAMYATLGAVINSDLGQIYATGSVVVCTGNPKKWGDPESDDPNAEYSTDDMKVGGIPLTTRCETYTQPISIAYPPTPGRTAEGQVKIATSNLSVSLE